MKEYFKKILGLAVVIIISKTILSYYNKSNQVTFRKYFQDTIQSGGLVDATNKIVDQWKSKSGTMVSDEDYSKIRSELNLCLENEFSKWLASKDPELEKRADKHDLIRLMSPHIKICTDKYTK